MLTRYVALLAFLGLLIAPRPAAALDLRSVDITQTRARVAKMPLHVKVGQMMMVGFSGTRLTPTVRSQISRARVGTFIIFSRNIASHAQVKGLTAAMQRTAVSAKHPARLLIAVDQEGDPIRRFPRLAPYYSEPRIGRMGSRGPGTAEYQAYLAGRQLRALGITVNLTPVLDLSTGPSSVMANRSYGTEPARVSVLGVRSVKGYARAGEVSCPKHFPGHGYANGDSEYEDATVYGPASLLKRRDVAPFRAAVAEGAPMVMTAHLRYPGLDPSRRYASLSRRIVTGLLRQDLGFDGVIISDDLEMGAITRRMSVPVAAVAAVQAGSDMVMVCHTPSRQAATERALIDAISKGKISRAQVDASVVRVLVMKQRYGLGL
jgi:beta-N-acetylhexosaminidase